MTPTELRELAELLDIGAHPIPYAKITSALRTIADRDEKLMELVEKWRQSRPAGSDGDSGVYCHGLHACADELSALLDE